MRPLPISIILSLAIRVTATRRAFPCVEEYRRNFTCTPPLKQFSNLMADLNQKAMGEEDKPCESAEGSKILEGESKPSEQVVKDTAEETVEPALPKLSAADFRVYNRMAEGMQYYVSVPVTACYAHPRWFLSYITN